MQELTSMSKTFKELHLSSRNEGVALGLETYSELSSLDTGLSNANSSIQAVDAKVDNKLSGIVLDANAVKNIPELIDWLGNIVSSFGGIYVKENN